MKVDNLILLESLFLPEHRNKLGVIYKLYKHKTLPQCKTVIELHVDELKEKENLDLRIDFESLGFELLTTYEKALLNRLKAFKAQ